MYASKYVFATLGWFVLACLLPHSPVAAETDVVPIGRVLRDTGETVMGAQRHEQSARSHAISDVARDPLDRKQLLARLNAVVPDVPFNPRGAREVSLYAKASPSVVLIVTNTGIGSGTLISNDGRILTNWHVIHNAREVGVVFKPAAEGRKLGSADVKRAKLLRIDQVADLALLSVANVPAGYKSLELGNMSDVQVGSDVHAIGHPTGESWTYTKGLVSQIRKGYEWVTESRIKHRADVIQTQTPINPGNSGGPLINDEGRVVGVNSFKAQGEALNFAVGVEEVRRFLAASTDRYSTTTKPRAGARDSGCESRVLKKGRNKENNADRTEIDWNCDGVWDAILEVPDDRSKPILLMIDSKDNGKIDIVVVDTDRDGKWDYSLHDINDDGKPDLIGRHPDGQLKPSSFEPYLARR